MVQVRIEIDGNKNDYADCFHNVFAENEKEAVKQWNETDGRRIKSYRVIKEFWNVYFMEGLKNYENSISK